MLLMILGVSGIAQSCDQLPMPKVSQTRKPDGGIHTHQHRIHDFSNIVDDAREQVLEKLVYKFEDSTSFQLALVTVDDLGGNTGIDYGTALGNCWGVGQKGRENGILILVSFGARDWAIVTGRGSEIYLRDGETRLIAENHLIPALRSNDATTGFEQTVQAIIDHLGWISWEARESNRLEEERQAELIAQQRRQEFADGAKSFFFYLLQIILVALAGFFGFKGFRRMQKKQKLKNQMHDWERWFLDHDKTLLIDTKNWPTWAVTEGTDIKNKLRSSIDTYFDLKNAFWEKPFEDVDPDIKGINKQVDDIRNLVESFQEIPGKIQRYIKQAPIELEKIQEIEKNLSTCIADLKANGFTLQHKAREVEALEELRRDIMVWTEVMQKPALDSHKNIFDQIQAVEKNWHALLENLQGLPAMTESINAQMPGLLDIIALLEKDVIHPTELSALMKICPESVWINLKEAFAQAPALLQQAKEKVTVALQYNAMDVQRFDEAKHASGQAKQLVDQVQEMFRKAASTSKAQTEARDKYQSFYTSAKRAIESASSACSDSDVDYSTKGKLDDVVVALKNATISEQKANWMALITLLQELENDADTVRRKAQQDISDAESARRRARESSYSSSSSSTYSSSGSSYGGGSFGGGGSGGKF